MNFERLRLNQTRRIVICVMAVIAIALVGIFTTSRAKYQSTKSIPLVRGTITYTPYDYRIALINVSNEEHICNPEIDKCLNMLDYIPGTGYKLNETSYCETRNE
ncbi:MAG: hypothetical protein K2J20_01230, partial [Bacilli bacterium]|nr:hypothetical protein [Bacilli bacterium]